MTDFYPKCPICFDDIKVYNFFIFTCGHFICRACFDFYKPEFLEATCPFCRELKLITILSNKHYTCEKCECSLGNNEKHLYHLSCGHVYCSQCLNSLSNRKMIVHECVHQCDDCYQMAFPLFI